ncbi:MAG: cytochrome P450 [Pirellulales bacterium]
MTTRRIPPGPSSYFLGIDLIRRITADPLAFYDDARRRYGDVLYMRLGSYHDYTFFHPDAIHELLTTKAKSFARMNHQMKVFRQWNGDSLLIAEGSEWLRQRRILQPAFSAKRFEAYGRAVVDCVREHLQRAVPAGGGVVDFERVAIELTTAVICRTMFGVDLGEKLPRIRQAVEVLVRAGYSEMLSFTWPDWMPLPSVRRKRQAIATLDTMVRAFIRERRAGGADRQDLLSMMLLAVDEDADGKGLTDQEVRDNCVTIFLAGHDTTAAGITWLGWFLASRRQFTQRCRDEVQSATGGTPPEFKHLSQMTFLDQMIHETLRHRPPVIALFAREAIQEVEIGGWTLPKGALVHVLPYTVHHDERWFPNPDEFDPERFSPLQLAKQQPYAYFPFGVGPRWCIGGHFAQMEIGLAAAVLLQEYEIEPAEGQSEPTAFSDLSLRPKGGLRLRMTPR